MNDGYYNVKTAIDDIDIAKQITKSLLEKRLVSSVQQKEITSTWWWNNELEESKEYVLEIKTKKSLYKEVEQEIKKIHSYEVPEIYAEEIKDASKEYLDWIDENTR